MAIAAASLANAPMGVQAPRLAPPKPAKSKLDEFVATAKGANIELLPW
jgi:hypothetical protein